MLLSTKKASFSSLGNDIEQRSKSSTIASKCRMIELKVTPYFGKISLQEIKPIDIRRGAGTSCPAAGSIRGKGVYTIVEEASGAGATKCGKLKSGAGWISLDFTKEA